MREISSEEYAEVISATSDKVDMLKYNELNAAFDRGRLFATKQFMTTYKTIRDHFSESMSGLSFEVLDQLFAQCAGEIIGDTIDE